MIECNVRYLMHQRRCLAIPVVSGIEYYDVRPVIVERHSRPTVGVTLQQLHCVLSL